MIFGLCLQSYNHKRGHGVDQPRQGPQGPIPSSGVESLFSSAMRFRLIDQVVERSESQIVAIKAVTLAEEYLADHFPSFPVLPGVFMLEAMVQSARLLIPESDQRFVLGGVKALRYGSFVSPGEHLRVEVEMKKFDGELATFRGEGKVISPGGEVADADTAVSGRFTMRPVRTARIAVGARVGGDANP